MFHEKTSTAKTERQYEKKEVSIKSLYLLLKDMLVSS